MAKETGIDWTDSTWNPTRGCSRVSEGCRNCYAEKIAYRFSGPGKPFEGLVKVGADGRRKPEWNGAIRFVEEHLLDPLGWGPVTEPCGYCREKFARGEIDSFEGCVEGTERPRRIFVDSMSDLFHEGVTDAQLDQVFAVMALCPQHTFQVLTKRPERMLAYLAQACGRVADAAMRVRKEHRKHLPHDEPGIGPLGFGRPGAAWWPLANVWLGVSVEDQKTADARIPLLLQTPAAVRFISAEPLLGRIDLERTGFLDNEIGSYAEGYAGSPGYKTVLTARPPANRWVICGGESGPGARPMHPDWARGLRDQCVAAGVPYFFKQWGEWRPNRQATQDGMSFIEPHNLRWLDTSGEIGTVYETAARGSEALVMRVGKKAAGDLLDGRQWHEFPKGETR